jgi:predicted dehydrogenase
MKLAFVGCGRIAAVHAEAIIKYVLETNNTIEIVALIDTSLLNAEKNLKNHLSCPAKYPLNSKKLPKRRLWIP